MDLVADGTMRPDVKNSSMALVIAKWLIAFECMSYLIIYLFPDKIAIPLIQSGNAEIYELLLNCLKCVSIASMICVACSSRRLIVVGVILAIANSGIFNNIITLLFFETHTETNAFIASIGSKVLTFFGLSLFWLRAKPVRHIITALIVFHIFTWGSNYAPMAYPLSSIWSEIWSDFSDSEFESLYLAIRTIPYQIIIIPIYIACIYLWWKLLTQLQPSVDVDSAPVTDTFTSRPFVGGLTVSALIYGLCIILRNIFIAPQFPSLY